jgi:hypothetical protein
MLISLPLGKTKLYNDNAKTVCITRESCMWVAKAVLKGIGRKDARKRFQGLFRYVLMLDSESANM